MAHSEPAPAIDTTLAEAELGDVAALVCEAGWNQTAADWRIFLDLGTVYVMRSAARRVIATAATLAYGGAFAWISMVLVAGDHRRRGLATLLLNRCIEDLTARGLVAILDATPAGRAVYLPLGFEDSWGYHRLARPAGGGRVDAIPPPEGVTIRPITDADWAAMCAYDAAVFGADRTAVLARLRGRLPAAELVAYRAGRVVGLLLGRDGRSANQLGPLVADEEAIAESLLARSLAGVTGPAYIDLADSRVSLRDWLAAQGFSPQRPFTRMLLRRREAFDDTARIFAVAGPELG